MGNERDPMGIKRNFTAFALFVVGILLLVDIAVRIAPALARPEAHAPGISAVGYHQTFDDGSSYYTYTIFENTGEVYQCWWDGTQWNQKRVTNYRNPTLPPIEK